MKATARWLQLHNHYYFKTAIDVEGMGNLLRDGVPDIVAQFLYGHKSSLDSFARSSGSYAERKPLITVLGFAHYELLDPRLINDKGDFVAGESFWCIFIDGHEAFEYYKAGDAIM